MGYLGGVNITILLAATNLLENNDFLTNTFHFFHFVANHLGSEIIAMTPQLSFPELGFDDENWSDKPSSISNHDCLVLLTPTYPRMNTARTISRSSLQFIRSQSRLVCEKIERYVDGESVGKRADWHADAFADGWAVSVLWRVSDLLRSSCFSDGGFRIQGLAGFGGKQVRIGRESEG